MATNQRSSITEYWITRVPGRGTSTQTGLVEQWDQTRSDSEPRMHLITRNKGGNIDLLSSPPGLTKTPVSWAGTSVGRDTYCMSFLLHCGQPDAWSIELSDCLIFFKKENHQHLQFAPVLRGREKE